MHTPFAAHLSAGARVRQICFVAALVVGLVGGSISYATVTDNPGDPWRSHDITDPQEAAKVDSVVAPVLQWQPCQGGATCAQAVLPIDYDDPAAGTVSIGLTRRAARKPDARIGVLFVHPGGPAISATGLVSQAHLLFGDRILDQFDLVGLDPRGGFRSSPLRCFTSEQEHKAVEDALFTRPFPSTDAEWTAAESAAKTLGKACADNGGPLARAMSATAVARDLDVLRRAMGEEKLSFLGLSYGTHIGQVYANMFPDRVRAIALDGVLDAQNWTGIDGDERVQSQRVGLADGATGALKRALDLCAEAGRERCPFASRAAWARVTVLSVELRQQPMVFQDSISGKQTVIGYPEMARMLLSSLYDTRAPEVATTLLESLWKARGSALEERRRERSTKRKPAELRAMAEAAEEPTPTLALRPTMRLAGVPAELTAHAITANAIAPSVDLHTMRLAEDLSATDEAAATVPSTTVTSELYTDTWLETWFGATCGDAHHPSGVERWRSMMANEDRRAPIFGGLWAWNSVACARDSWLVQEKSRYQGPFTKQTRRPVLFVGNQFDPASNMRDAITASQRMPGSFLLTSDGWGHTSYFAQTCVRDKVDAYLIGGSATPALDTCASAYRPFAPPPAPEPDPEPPADDEPWPVPTDQPTPTATDGPRPVPTTGPVPTDLPRPTSTDAFEPGVPTPTWFPTSLPTGIVDPVPTRTISS